MLRAIFKKLAAAAPESSGPRVPEGMRVYVVGDVHGRLDLLRLLAARIAEDSRTASGLDVGTIFVGDYVDRGPQSAQVIEELAGGRFPTPIVALRGNHEEGMLRFLEDENVPGK